MTILNKSVRPKKEVEWERCSGMVGMVWRVVTSCLIVWWLTVIPIEYLRTGTIDMTFNHIMEVHTLAFRIGLVMSVIAWIAQALHNWNLVNLGIMVRWGEHRYFSEAEQLNLSSDIAAAFCAGVAVLFLLFALPITIAGVMWVLFMGDWAQSFINWFYSKGVMLRVAVGILPFMAFVFTLAAIISFKVKFSKGKNDKS